MFADMQGTGPTQPDHPELAAVYRQYVKFVWRSATRLGVPSALLEDAVQDVFLVAARRLPEFRAESSLKTWLFAITIRVVRFHRRSAWRHTRRIEAYANDQAYSDAADPYPRSDAGTMLERLLEQLEPERRAVFILIELEGMTAQEIAVALGIKVNTVYSRLRLARLQLERALAGPSLHPTLKEAR